MQCFLSTFLEKVGKIIDPLESLRFQGRSGRHH